MSNKLPHHYAHDYLKATSKEAQRLALVGCPEDWQELVKTHIRIKRMRDAHDGANKNHKQT